MTEDNFSAIFAEIIVSAKETILECSVAIGKLERAIDAYEAYKKEHINETH